MGAANSSRQAGSRTVGGVAPTYGIASAVSGRARIGGLVLLALLALATYFMLADFVNLRTARSATEPQPLSDLPMPQPWGGYGWRALARLAGDAGMLAPETAEETLETAAVRYPLDAQQWLDLAQLHARAGEVEAVDRALAKARASQPFERRALWRAAQIALQTGNDALAERQLRRWLQLYPHDTGEALFIGARWIDSAGDLVDRMLPPGRDYLVEAMRVAMRQRDADLAEAVWQRLEPRPGLDDAAFLNYVELLLAAGEIDRALALWASVDPAFDGRGIANASFSRPLGEAMGLNWRADRLPASVTVARDETEAWSEPASLRIAFSGKDNVHLAAPTIRIPVEPGQRYRLSGHWRADGLTTRSLPYLYLTGPDGLRERIPVPVAEYDWEDWELEFEAPEDARLVTLSLRRNRTDNFDRNIDGTLWLDDVRLEPIEAEALAETSGD